VGKVPFLQVTGTCTEEHAPWEYKVLRDLSLEDRNRIITDNQMYPFSMLF
jgi:hypothetical protein